MEEPIYFESEKERLAYLRGKNKKVDVVPIEDKKPKKRKWKRMSNKTFKLQNCFEMNQEVVYPQKIKDICLGCVQLSKSTRIMMWKTLTARLCDI